MEALRQPRFDADEFFERGFVTIPALFSRTEVERMRRAFDRLVCHARSLRESCMSGGSQFVIERDDRLDGSVRIHRVVWCGAVEPVLAELGADPRLLGLAASLLGSERMHQLINQAHFKLPGDGVTFPWHQDSTHRRFGRSEWKDVNGKGSYVQTVIALDDVDERNGPILFIPGSCRHGHIPVDEAGEIPRRFVTERPPVSPRLRAGDVLAFGPYTIHSSGPNLSSRPRRAFINGFACPGANSRVYPGEGAGRELTLRSPRIK